MCRKNRRKRGLRLFEVWSSSGTVDNETRSADLKRCWASFNPEPNAPYAYIAKRVVAREAVLEIRFDQDEEDARTADARRAAAAA